LNIAEIGYIYLWIITTQVVISQNWGKKNKNKNKILALPISGFISVGPL
jgi:hypothetical protein